MSLDHPDFPHLIQATAGALCPPPYIQKGSPGQGESLQNPDVSACVTGDRALTGIPLSPRVLAFLTPCPGMPANSMPVEGAAYLAFDQVTGDSLAHGPTVLEALARAGVDPARVEVLRCNPLGGRNLWRAATRLSVARRRGTCVAYRGDCRGLRDSYGREITLAPVGMSIRECTA